MAEALLNYRAKGRFHAFSAGNHPKGDVHPLALDILKRNHIPGDGFRSKSWDEFAVAGRLNWISCSLSATAPLRKSVRYGPASR